MPDFDWNYNIEKHFGVLSTDRNGWRKEVNLISWNGQGLKIDIRNWAPGREKAGKGITLTREEAEKLTEFIATALETGK